MSARLSSLTLLLLEWRMCPFSRLAHTTIEPDDVEGFSVDATVGDGDTLELGGATLEFIHAPGHTMGSLCILHRQTGVLFSGDMILGDRHDGHQPGARRHVGLHRVDA